VLSRDFAKHGQGVAPGDHWPLPRYTGQSEPQVGEDWGTEGHRNLTRQSERFRIPPNGCREPAALANEARVRPGPASPIMRAGATAARSELTSSPPAVPSPCHSEHDATGLPRSTTDTHGPLTCGRLTIGVRQHEW
jgi:hypothetical protein